MANIIVLAFCAVQHLTEYTAIDGHFTGLITGCEYCCYLWLSGRFYCQVTTCYV